MKKSIKKNSPMALYGRQWFLYEGRFSISEINIFTLLTSLIGVSGMEQSYRCWRTAGAGEKRPQMQGQLFSLYEISAFPTHRVWGQLEGWLREKDISCLFRASLCEQREGSQLLLASSHRPCGKPDGFISASHFSEMLGGGGFYVNRLTTAPHIA